MSDLRTSKPDSTGEKIFFGEGGSKHLVPVLFFDFLIDQSKSSIFKNVKNVKIRFDISVAKVCRQRHWNSYQ